MSDLIIGEEKKGQRKKSDPSSVKPLFSFFFSLLPNDETGD
jgi:hypothetical protein